MDNVLGTVTFTKEEVAAIGEARRGWSTIFGAHNQQWQSTRQDDLNFVTDVLADAAGYINVNIGRVNPENKFLPAVKFQEFLCNTGTLGRLHVAMLDVNSAWLSLPWSVRRSNAVGHLDVTEVLDSLYKHVAFVVAERNKPDGRQY